MLSVWNTVGPSRAVAIAEIVEENREMLFSVRSPGPEEMAVCGATPAKESGLQEEDGCFFPVVGLWETLCHCGLW